MKLKKWEIALAAGLVVTLLVGYAAETAQRALADKLIRLHVVASGDGDEEQKLKLKVRDAVLDAAGEELASQNGRTQAEERLFELIPVITAAAEDVVKAEGYDMPVSVSLCGEDLPTREYDTFALPAGEYLSLRVTIGEGEGRNWWCVVYPPLCAAASVEELDAAAEAAKLTGEERSLITRDGETYVIKFKLIEWWGSVKKKLSR